MVTCVTSFTRRWAHAIDWVGLYRSRRERREREREKFPVRLFLSERTPQPHSILSSTFEKRKTSNSTHKTFLVFLKAFLFFFFLSCHSPGCNTHSRSCYTQTQVGGGERENETDTDVKRTNEQEEQLLYKDSSASTVSM